MKIKNIFFLVILNISILFSQEISNENKNKLEFIDGDTIPILGIPLKEIVVFQPLKFNSTKELMDYIILRRRTFKVYPYAKLAADRLNVLNDRIEKITTKRKRKKYLKLMEKFVYNEFEEELKRLSRSEGRILIKLINRQTGNSAFELIRELRTGWRAFIYQTTASMFKLSLKEKFDPEQIKEDYLIEDILQRAFAEKYLEEQESKLNYDLNKLFEIWK
tara:strand:- start:385 stop:1041 length:657 start_codon:yes stop_codon:yes gene_type:complete